LKERIRDVKAGAFLDTFLLDIRYGMRLLRKHPSFALAAIVTLGLGIGANTAIFTVVDALALRSLPVREPSELVYLEMSTQTGRNSYFSYPMFERLQERTMSLSGLAASRVKRRRVYPEAESVLNGVLERLRQVCSNSVALGS
jgi:putative ABC transport system permease protein